MQQCLEEDAWYQRTEAVDDNNNNNIHICIAPYGRNFRGDWRVTWPVIDEAHATEWRKCLRACAYIPDVRFQHLL